MKTSFYNYILDNGNTSLLYNCASDHLLILHPQLKELYIENVFTLDKIKEKHPEFFNALYSLGFIVEDDINESDKIIHYWKEEDNTTQTYSITVNPTLDCNMRCWYCYEKHDISQQMDIKIKNAIIKLVENKCKEDRYKNIRIDFFGGEPLLRYQDIIKPIMEEARSICQKFNKKLNFGFTTNAYLLGIEILNKMQGFNVSFQITIDGNEAIHDNIRFTKEGKGSYKTIVKNATLALQMGFEVLIRCNYMADTLVSFVDLLNEFKDIENDHRKKLRFNFQQIWQDRECNEERTEKKVKEMEDIFLDENFNVSPSSFNKTGRCYADNSNCIVINYDGNVFKCTARDFIKERSEGRITETGEIKWNDRYYKRMDIVYGGKACRACKIFPICHGGCTQNKLEATVNLDSCIKRYSEKEKIQFVTTRVRDIINLKLHNNKCKQINE